jgi:hypothetical protein
MTRISRLLSASLLTLSALAFAGSVYIASERNWTPATLPLPGPGLRVDDSFHLATGGKLQFEASVPISAIGDGVHLPDLPPIACDLEAQIRRRGGAKRVVRIRRFEYSGRGTTESYSSEPAIELGRGTYELSVLNRGTTEIFGQSGAVLTLTRFEHPTEAYLQGVLLRGVGWCALAAGLVSVVFSELLARRRSA